MLRNSRNAHFLLKILVANYLSVVFVETVGKQLRILKISDVQPFTMGPKLQIASKSLFICSK